MKELKKEIIKQLEYFRYRKNIDAVFRDSIEYQAVLLSIECDTLNKYSERCARWEKIISGYDGQDGEQFIGICKNINSVLRGMTDNYGDHLGELYMEIEAGNKHAGQFFTPYDVSRLIAKITLGEKPPEKKMLTVNEPACGSGGMIIAVLEELDRLGFNYADNALVVANDIDRNCVHMAYLQLSWAGVPAVVKHQDTITQKTFDTFITPAFALQYAKFRRVYESLSGNAM